MKIFFRISVYSVFVLTNTFSGAVDSTFTKIKTVDASPVIRTLSREIARSMENLKLKNNPRPYFISYLLWDVQSYRMQASLGSCEISDFDRQHMLDVDLRVGDYKLDNSNFQGGVVFGPRLRLPLPDDNDTALLALSLWAATDARYKVAIEQIAQKRAFLTNHNVHDSLPDFSKQQALQKIEGDEPSPPDSANAKKLGIELSRFLSQYAWLEESRVGYNYFFTTFYYTDAAGSRYIQTIKEHTFLVSLFTQAKDGSPLWDYLRISTRDPLKLGEGAMSLIALEDSLKPILKRLDYLRNADPVLNYRGPILLTGTAAGELLNKAFLAPNLRLREPLGANVEPNFMVSMAGRKMFPSEVSIIDTPSLQKFQNRSLFGHYLLDHQGQPAQNISLVEEGRVHDYFLGKVPVFKAKDHKSNGHWRYNGGFGGVTLLRSKNSFSESDLKTKLAHLGADEGTGYGMVVSKLLDEDAFRLLHHPLASQLAATPGLDGHGSFVLYAPCEMDKLDSRTGQVTPVRGLSFPVIDSKSLRDIVAIGSEPHLHEPQASFSILCPSLLFSLLDLKGSHSTQPHLPLIP